MTPEIRRLLDEALYENEGTGLGGTTLMRCKLCHKGWQSGSTWGQARHHTGANCPGERLEAALLAASPVLQGEDTKEDPRVDPSVVAHEHGDLPRTSQPKGSRR